MSVYLWSFFLILVIGFFCKHGKSDSEESRNRKTIFFLVFAWIILSLIEGLRAYTVGTDTPFYVRTFQILSRQRYEIGYWMLMKVIHSITQNPTALLMVCALITNGLFMIAIYKMSWDCYTSIFAFITLMFYFVSYNAVRQSIAISLVVCAYSCIRNNRLKSFFILILIAIAFHSSASIALLYLPIYYYNNKEFNRTGIQQDIIEFVVTCTVVFAGYFLFERGLGIFARLMPVYSHYLISDYATTTGGIQRPLVYTAIYLCLVFLTNETSAEKKMLTLPLSIALMFAFLHMRISAVSRFMWYFDIISILALPYIFENLRLKGQSKSIFKLCVTVILVLFMFYNLRAGYMRVNNYTFVWN